MKVVPAILSQEEDDLREKLKTASAFTGYAQLDLMDGRFVPSKSVEGPAIAGLDFPLDYEAHLMVTDPLAWLRDLPGKRLKRVIFHHEAVSEPEEVAEKIRSRGVPPGVALNPGTTIDEAAAVLPLVDALLVMTVNPGFYGSPFIAEALNKVKEARNCFPDLVVGIDGGVSLENLRLAVEAGVDYVCVGSRVLLAEDPAASYAEFKARIRELDDLAH